MGNIMPQPHLTLSGLDRLRSRSFRFLSLARKGAKLGHMLLLSTNRTQCGEYNGTLTHLTLCDLDRSNLKSVRF